MKFAMIVDDSARKLPILPKLNLKLRSESEAKSLHIIVTHIAANTNVSQTSEVLKWVKVFQKFKKYVHIFI